MFDFVFTNLFVNLASNNKYEKNNNDFLFICFNCC